MNDSDEQAAIKAARACYYKINRGQHDNPVTGFEFIQSKLKEAKRDGQYILLDESLSPNSQEAEKFIREVVIPRCYLRYAAWLQCDLDAEEHDMSEQEIINARKKIVHYCESSGHFKDGVSYDKVAPELQRLAAELQGMTSGPLTSKDLEEMRTSWESLVGKRSTGTVPNLSDGMVMQISPAKLADTVSLKITFNLPESEVLSAFDVLRLYFKVICRDEGMENGAITTRLGREGNKHEVIATVDAKHRDKISDLIEVINDGTVKDIIVNQQDTVTCVTSFSVIQGNARDTLRIMKARIGELCEENGVPDYTVVTETQPGGRSLINVTCARSSRENLTDAMVVFTSEILKGRGGIAGRE